MAPAAVTALAAALEVPFGARREQHNYARRGRARVNAIRDGDGSNGKRRTGLTGHVLALALHDHLHTPCTVIGALPGIGHTTAAHAARLTRQLIHDNAIPLPPRPPPRPSAPSMTCANTPPSTAFRSPARPPQPTLPQMPH